MSKMTKAQWYSAVIVPTNASHGEWTSLTFEKEEETDIIANIGIALSAVFLFTAFCWVVFV